jgi:hypothetical protein
MTSSPVSVEGYRIVARHVFCGAPAIRTDADQNGTFGTQRAVPVLRVGRLLILIGIGIHEPGGAFRFLKRLQGFRRPLDDHDR